MEYKKLCEEIEREAGRKMQTPLNFKWLSERIFERVHETVSVTTLMRMWGYRKEGGTPREATLDVLARYLGYADYWEFKNKNEEATEPADSEKDMHGAGDEEARVESVENKTAEKTRKRRLWILGGLLGIVVFIACWFFCKCGKTNEGLPAGAKDWTWVMHNPRCDVDSLNVWTYTHGGMTLEENGTLTYFMKDFNVSQVVHGLPAGEYELRVKAWHLPCNLDQARYDYEHAEDKESGTALSKAEIYAGAFTQRVKNYVSEINQETCRYENVLRFVVLDDSVRIGFRSDENRHRGSRAQADDFRLYLLRKAKTEKDFKQMTARRDSAQRVEDARPYLKAGDRIPEKLNGADAELMYNYIKNGDVVDCWMGHEAPIPQGWITEQETSSCKIVHRADVGRGFGDSDIYLEYLSDKPAKPGLLLGQHVFLEAGTYYFGAIFFAQSANWLPTDVCFAVNGYESNCPTDPMMDWRCFSITLHEAQEVTVGLWAPKGSDVRRAGICKLNVWAAI